MAFLKSTSSKRNWAYLLLGTTVTVVLLTWTLRDLSPAIVWQTLQHARLEWLLFGLVIHLANCSVRVWRWGTVLEAYCNPGRFDDRASATFVGFAVSSVLPASAGEVVRVALLHRLSGVPFGPALGSIFAERLLDVVMVFLLLLAAFAANSTLAGSGLGTLTIGWLGAALVVICIGFWLAARYPHNIARLVGAISQAVGLKRFKTRIISSTEGLLGGLSAFRQPRRLIEALLQTLLSWGLNGLTYWAVMIALDITAPGFIGAVLVQSIAAFAIAIPSSPGYIGPFEASIRFALSIYQIPVDTAIAYALTLRLLMYIITPLIGFAIAVRLGLSRIDLGISSTNK